MARCSEVPSGAAGLRPERSASGSESEEQRLGVVLFAGSRRRQPAAVVLAKFGRSRRRTSGIALCTQMGRHRVASRDPDPAQREGERHAVLVRIVGVRPARNATDGWLQHKPLEPRSRGVRRVDRRGRGDRADGCRQQVRLGAHRRRSRKCSDAEPLGVRCAASRPALRPHRPAGRGVRRASLTGSLRESESSL